MAILTIVKKKAYTFMATKLVKRPRTFTRKKTTTSPIKKIEKKLEKQEVVLEEIKTLIEKESHPKTSFVEKTSEPITAVAPESKAEESEENEPKKSRKGLWINLIIVFIGSFLIVTFFLFLREKKIEEMKQLEEASIPTPTATAKPSPTEAAIDVSAYTISVLNGSGTAGVAAQAKTLLEGEDYFVETVGNASESTYEETLIKAKKSVPSAFIDALKKSLESSYVLDPIVAELADTKNTDVEIIIGSETP